MKVKVNITEEVTEEQRVQIRNAIDGTTDSTRQASRDECRDFIWRHGSSWALLLDRSEEYQEDLIGSDTDEPDLLSELL
jgi:hypothetical protein